MGEMTHAHKVLVRKPDHSFGVYGKIMIKCILRKWHVTIWLDASGSR